MKCHLLQPDRGNDQEDGEDDHEEVEDEDKGEGGGQLVHQPGKTEILLLAFVLVFDPYIVLKQET